MALVSGVTRTAALSLALGSLACGEGGREETEGASAGPTSPTAPQGSTSSGSGDPGSTTESLTGPDAPTTAGPGGDASTSTTTSLDPTTASGDPETTTGGDDCLPPDALILLDRTLTMHKTTSGAKPVDAPAYASSKWSQSITAIEALAAPPLDATVRFGLELWPRDPGGGQCLTLAEKVTESKQPTNPSCEAGEVVIEPAANNGATIAAALDPTTTLLCSTTPTGAALYTAADYFAAHKEPGREQYAILVTDGADWDQSCPDPSPLKAVHDLAKQGVRTFVVGFSGEEAQLGATDFLNDMACAGQTATGFPLPCVEGPEGFVAVEGGTAPIYLQADDATELGAALTAVAGELCCGCTKACDPPEVLFALDRTLTMHKTVDGGTPADAPLYASSKWYQAITAIEEVAGNLGDDLRIGLELWPKDPGGGACITLAERITNTKQATNPQCQEGEIVIPPALGNGGALGAAIDPQTTLICSTTPTGAGLLSAADWLIDHTVPGRKQYVVLVTDGADWDFSCPDPSPLLVTQQIAAAGIQTYVVGFFGAEAQAGALQFLNDMACAGRTAKDFEQNCAQTGSGYVAADPQGMVPLYLQAGNGELPATLQGVADEILQYCVPG